MVYIILQIPCSLTHKEFFVFVLFVYINHHWRSGWLFRFFDLDICHVTFATGQQPVHLVSHQQNPALSVPFSCKQTNQQF